MAQHSGFGGMMWGSSAWGGIVLQTKQTKETNINGQVRIEHTNTTSISGQFRI